MHHGLLAATRLRTHLLTFTALLLLLQLAAVAAQGQTQITRCLTFVTTPGDYVLANDLTCSSYGVIITRANGVTLNLAGHRITGSSTAAGTAGIKVQSAAREVRIQGPGVISNYTGVNSAGVQLISTGSQEITGVTCTGNTIGFLLAGPARVHGNIATTNGEGFLIINSADMEITNNLATGNTTDGIITASAGGIRRIVDNAAAFNGRYGIAVENGSRGNTMVNNTALGNGTFDLFDGNRACQNTWEDNTFGTSQGPCIH